MITSIRKLTADEGKHLVNRCISGEKAAWDQFVEQFSGLIYSSINKTVRACGYRLEPDRVNDLYQDVFVSLCQDDFSKLKAFRWRCSLASWVRLITTRLTIDFIRKDAKDNKRTLSIDAAYEATDEPESSSSLLDTLADPRMTPEREAASQEIVELIRECIAELSPRDRQLLVLFDEGWKAEDIARLLKKTVAAVYMQKKRTLDNLKQCLHKKDVSF